MAERQDEAPEAVSEERETNPSPDGPADTPGGLSFASIVMSTLAAAIGVQSKKNKERDFEHGSAPAFIAAGLIFTVLFVLTLVGVVRLVLSQSG